MHLGVIQIALHKRKIKTKFPLLHQVERLRNLPLTRRGNHLIFCSPAQGIFMKRALDWTGCRRFCFATAIYACLPSRSTRQPFHYHEIAIPQEKAHGCWLDELAYLLATSSDLKLVHVCNYFPCISLNGLTCSIYWHSSNTFVIEILRFSSWSLCLAKARVRQRTPSCAWAEKEREVNASDYVFLPLVSGKTKEDMNWKGGWNHAALSSIAVVSLDGHWRRAGILTLN